MSALPESRLPERFWEQVKQARHRLVAVDYDGTLAPLQVMRDRALPVAGVMQSLLALAETPDNTVDEDAFRVLRGRGFGLRVARGPCHTAADGRLASRVEVAGWLADLGTILQGGRQPPGDRRSA